MKTPPSGSLRPVPLVVLLLVSSSLFVESRRLGEQKSRNGSSSVSALFVFGDSTVDSGNNNYIKTTSQSNFPPYGKDFPNHIPTGRFTNGKLVTDFVASYTRIKDYIPPYLDPTLSLDELKTGVCFASASTGYDPLTSQLSGVISMEKQLKYFKEYKSIMEGYIGKERTKTLINNAAFLISAGTNDFIVDYYGPPIRRQTYTISAYQQLILQFVQQFLQGLLGMGARKIAVVGLPPIGCVPAVITLNSDNALTHRGCIDSLSAVARDYNRLLRSKLTAMQMQTHATMITYVDIYTPLDDMIKKPLNYGFEKVNSGCCGSGLLEASILCNSYSVVCSEDSKYVFWDAVHPTEAAYYQLFKAVRPVIDLFLKDS